MKLASRIVWCSVIVLGLWFLPAVAAAHPMGNFSINHYTKIRVERDAVRLDYIIDMAEIPTFQEMQRSGITARSDDPALAGYLENQAEALGKGLSLRVNNRALALEVIARHAIFPPGAGGLPTMKMGFTYRAALPEGGGSEPRSIHYQDGNFADRAGWKEIVAVNGPDAHTVRSSVPEQDRSGELSNYPTDLLHSPPQVLEADVSFAPGPAAIARNATGHETSSELRLAANRQSTPRNAFTELIKSNRVDVAFLLTAALIAAILGGFHALEPGHGKTLVAAYLVGSHGKARHAVMLGGIVTASHTVSVYALGLITLYASQRIMPEQLYPWIGIASGALVAGLGFTLFLRRYLTDDSHAAAHHHTDGVPHDHGDGHLHSHPHHSVADDPPMVHQHTWWGGHVHAPHSHSEPEQEPHEHAHHDGLIHVHDELPASTTPAALSAKSLFALGVTGGIVPCPAALVVLLGALAFHRIVFGLFLIVAFSAGLAAVLISFGLAMVYAGRLVSRLGTRGALTERWLPLASSAVITIIGVVLLLQSLMSAGVLRNGI